MTAPPCPAAAAGERAIALITEIRERQRVRSETDEIETQLALLEADSVRLAPTTTSGALFVAILAHDALTHGATDSDILRARELVMRLVEFLGRVAPGDLEKFDYYV
jgi:hypothetical protein